MLVLVVNSGSSSLKLRLLDDDELVESSDSTDLDDVLAAWPTPDAVGHRIVQGGADFRGAALIDGDVRARMAALTELAPLHQPAGLSGIDAVASRLPDVPAVACFDTVFHATMPDEASVYAVPERWRHEWGVRRYGFHGLSHAYAAARGAELVGGAEKVISCHLGSGASLCAVVGGRSVDTTMGFTPLEGLIMGTRSGTVDPALVTWLQTAHGLSAAEVADALTTQSGLLALAGTADMRSVTERDDDSARFALRAYVHRLVGAIASMVAAAGGVDVLVFTGGVGEASAVVRSMALERLGWLGVALDGPANRAAHGDADITGDGSSAGVVVVTAREDLQIARETRSVVAGS